MKKSAKKLWAFALSCLLVLNLAPLSAVATSDIDLDDTDEVVYEEGVVYFEKLSDYLREGSTAVLAMQAGIDAQNSVDRQWVYDTILESVNDLTDVAWALTSLGSAATSAVSGLSEDIDPEIKTVLYYIAQGQSSALSLSASDINTAADTLREQLELYEEDEYNYNLALFERQMNDNIEQVITAAESIYLGILTLEGNLDVLSLQVLAMEDTLAEMTLRNELGQISNLTLAQVQMGYDTMVSQEASLGVTLSQMKAQLQLLMGETPTGELTLAPLPSFTDAQNEILDLSYEDALALATEASYTIFAAEDSLADAKEDWNEGKWKPVEYDAQYNVYLAAQYSYSSTVSSFQMSFLTLYQNAQDKAQLSANAEKTYFYESLAHQVNELKYERGMISEATYTASENTLAAARLTYETAVQDAFTAQYRYMQAVNLGILV